MQRICREFSLQISGRVLHIWEVANSTRPPEAFYELRRAGEGGRSAAKSKIWNLFVTCHGEECGRGRERSKRRSGSGVLVSICGDLWCELQIDDKIHLSPPPPHVAHSGLKNRA
jgi:hypothetical protein